MAGSIDPLDGSRRSFRPRTSGSLAAARNAALTRVDLVGRSPDSAAPATPVARASSDVRSELLPDEQRARDTGGGTRHVAARTISSSGSSGRVEGSYATARDLRASLPDGVPVPTIRFGRPTAAETRAVAPHTAAAPQADRDARGFTLLPVRLGGRRYSNPTSATSYNPSEGSTPLRSIAQTGAADPEPASASRSGGNRRVASTSSMRSLPTSRALESVLPRRSHEDSMASSPRGFAAEARERHGSSFPLTGPSRVPRRGDGGSGENSMVFSRAGIGLTDADEWRTPIVAYNAVERRIGQDTTALRAVSARLDAAATAIDAVEIGVRSASDSLDSLLHLLEFRPATPALTGSRGGVIRTPLPSPAAVGNRPTGDSGTRARGLALMSSLQTSGSAPVDVPSSEATAVAGGLSGAHVVTPSSSPVANGGERDESWSHSPAFTDRGTAPAASAWRRVGDWTSRVGNISREATSSSPVVGQTAVEGDAKAGANQTGVTSPRRRTRHQEDPAARSNLFGEAESEIRPPLDDCLASVLSTPHRSSSSAGVGISGAASSRLESNGTGTRGGLDNPPSASRGARSGSRHLGTATRAHESRAVDATTTAPPSSLRRSGGISLQDNLSRSSEGVGSERIESRGSEGGGTAAQAHPGVAGTTADATGGGRRTSRGGDTSLLPVLELEAAMDGIDAERGRLILEIARLRVQQNDSLVHLQRLQQEQFVVRQRQVSTLSDIVNSFGRTVEAAGALPHGEDSSLGRISGDVVSTLRRMLRLLSATVPAAAGSALRSPAGLTPSAFPVPIASAHGAPAVSPPPASLRPSDVDVATRSTARESTASGSGPYSVGGRVALRPAGDLTQEVIDAALQALPRLAAAATAISGARRMQGYLAAGEGGNRGDVGNEGRDAGRCCSAETIAALPDAPKPKGDIDSRTGVGECVICLSEESAAGLLMCHLPCDHVFHRVCVGKWLRVQDSCPTCRRQVPNVEVSSATPPPPEVA